MTGADVSNAFEKYGDTVYRVCFTYFKGGEQDIEDAVSAVFLKYMEHGIQFESPEHEKAWLIVTAQNYCKNILKSWWRRKRVSDEESGDIPSEREELPFEVSDVMSAVLSLPEKQRNAVYLYYYEGYSTEEIAKMYYISENAVYSRLSKGKRRLKRILQDNDDFS